MAQAHDGGWPWWSGSPPCWRLRFSCMARPRSNILRFSSWEPTYWHWRQWYSTPLWLGGKHHSDWLFANVYRLPLTVIALIIAIGPCRLWLRCCPQTSPHPKTATGRLRTWRTSSETFDCDL